MRSGNEFENIIWLQTAFLGDMVLTSAAINLAKAEFPNAKQVLLSTKMGVAALAGCPGLDIGIAFDKSGINVFKTVAILKKALQDAGVDLNRSVLLRGHRSLRSGLIAKMLGANHSVTYTEASLAFFADALVDRIAVWHETQRIAVLLEALGVAREKIFAAKPKLTAVEAVADKPLRQALLRERPLVALAPGSVWATKRWPIENFAVLALKLVTAGYDLLLTGGSNEAPLANQICQALKHSGIDVKARVENWAGVSDFSDLLFALPKLKLMVSNDSAPVHFASALNTPCLALFGPTSSAMGFGPLSDKSLSLELSDLECRPCSAHGQKQCPLGHFRCMKNLSVEQVFQACQKLLE